MRRWFDNPYIDALAKTMFLSALFHMILLGIYGLVQLNYEILNLFTILGLNLLFPGIAVGLAYFLVSIIFMMIVYKVVLHYWTLKK